MIYYHANAEDVGYAFSFAQTLGANLRVHVLLVEYPGYGVYAGKPNAA